MNDPRCVADFVEPAQADIVGGEGHPHRFHSAAHRSVMTAETDARVRELLAEVEGETTCVVELLCDRYPADDVAFTVVGGDLNSENLTYGNLKKRSEAVAAHLSQLGVAKGDRVATLMSTSAHYVVTLLAIWRLGAIHVPIYAGFDPAAIAARLGVARCVAVVCDPDQEHKLAPSPEMPAERDWSVVIAGTAAETDGNVPAAQLATDEPIVHIFTSGTGGTPKAVPMTVKAMAAARAYLEFGIEVRDEDVFWNIADPGWAYGLFYGIIAPMMTHRRSMLLDAELTPELFWAVLERFRVTNLAGETTLFRTLRNHEGSHRNLRAISCAGESLNKEIVEWAERCFGQRIRDHYGQTELGMCIINGWNGAVRLPVKDGSMGKPMPGWNTAVLLDDEDELAPVGILGRVAVRVDSPFMWFDGYAYDDPRTAEMFSADRTWYYTGDAGYVDEDGYYFFTSPEDDIILMGGYRIAPFEVETTLISHPAVAEAAVVGVPDALRGELLEAFVALSTGHYVSDELIEELKDHVRQHYAAHAYPRFIHFIESLPKTPTGKIRRVQLRQQRSDELRGK